MLLKDNKETSNNINPMFSDEKLYNFLNCGQFVFIYIDLDGKIQYATPIAGNLAGIKQLCHGESIVETDFAKKYPVIIKQINESIDYIKSIEASNNAKKHTLLKTYQSELELTDQNNNSYQMVIRAYTSLDKIKGIILVFYDITKRKSAELVLETEKEKYRIIAELTDTALWEYDLSKKAMKQYKKLNGRYSNSNLIVKDYRNTALQNGWVHPEDIVIFEAFCDSMDRGDANIQYELRIKGDSKEYIWVRFQGTALGDRSGKIQLILGRTVNIDREHKDLEKLIQKTERDALTGLYNRATTKEKAEKCFQYCNKEDPNEVHNFLIVDIDNFKQANDQWGHLYGDILLESFSKQLEDLFDSTDIVGRIGGDEFVVIQRSYPDIEKTAKAAKAICDIARKYNSSGPQSNNTFTVSVGVSTYPKDGRNYDALYRKADVALYIAKTKGKDQYSFYTSEMEEIIRQNQLDNQPMTNGRNYEFGSPIIEKRMLNIAFDIVNESVGLEDAIGHILGEIGRFYDLSRVTIFEKSVGNMEARVSYEWRNTGITSCGYDPSKNLEALMQEYDNQFRQNGIYYYNDLNTANATCGLQKLYEKLGSKALVQCAIYDGTEFMGTINYEDCIAARKWSKSEIDTLYTLTKLISSYIIQIKNKQKLDNEIFFTKVTLNNQKLCNYAVKESTYELLYFSEYTKTLYPEIRLGQACYEAIFNRDKPCIACPLKGLNQNNNSYSLEAYDERKDSWYSMTATLETMPNKEKIRLICSCDVTGFISRVNSKDTLTGLLTLSKFEADAMKLLIAPSSQKYLLIYIDFDKFKNINDEWGYSTGNEILVTFADIAEKHMKPSELLCRISADKFVVMISYQDKAQALQRIESTYELIVQEFIEYFPKIYPVFTSGIYFLGPEDKNLSLAIDRANLARKTVKGIHKSNYAIYDKSLHQQVTKENMIANKMHDALKNNEFVVYMQPKIDLATSEIIGGEALVRWKLPSGELLSPMEFIPIFEKNGFIDELDFYVYDKSLAALREWLDIGKREIIISLNLSRSHLKDSYFLSKLDKLMEKHQIPTRLIELEVTESMFFADLDRLIFIVKCLRDRGFLISIDDFGSGYSSLNMLKTLPIDILKLDREFFMKNEMGHHEKIVISGIISLAKGLGLKVISEGVETEEQLYFLKESSCDMAQGYYFYRPLPMEEFISLIE